MITYFLSHGPLKLVVLPIEYCPLRIKAPCQLLFFSRHYAVPLVPDIPGMKGFKGTIVHSHNYRLPEPYKDQVVVCLGAAASGQDLSLDIAAVAKEVSELRLRYFHF